MDDMRLFRLVVAVVATGFALYALAVALGVIR